MGDVTEHSFGRLSYYGADARRMGDRNWNSGTGWMEFPGRRIQDCSSKINPSALAVLLGVSPGTPVRRLLSQGHPQVSCLF